PSCGSGKQSSAGGGSRSARKVPCVACTRAPSLRAMEAAPKQWSACSCVRSTSVRSRRSRPASAQRRRVSRRESPASTRTRAPSASIQAALPPLPLERTHRRTERVYQNRPAAYKPRGSVTRRRERDCRCAREARLLLRSAHASHEEKHQGPQQGEAKGSEAPALAPHEEPAEGQARPVATAPYGRTHRGRAGCPATR